MAEPKQTIAGAMMRASALLREAGIDEFRREAAALAAFVLDKTPVFLIAHPEYEPTPDEADRYDSVIRRRSNREPFHYITGTKEFYGLDFAVGPGVLIPRPETELLVEDAIDILAKINRPKFLEIGVGSGCISVSLLLHARNADAVAVDISPSAIEVAASNAARHDVAVRLDLKLGDIYSGISGTFDLIVANPPYIPDGDLDSLQPEVGAFEPHRALFGGFDGLSIVRRIILEAPDFLRENGFLLIEIGFGQAASVKELFAEPVWGDVGFIRDLQGIERIVRAKVRS